MPAIIILLAKIVITLLKSYQNPRHGIYLNIGRNLKHTHYSKLEIPISHILLYHVQSRQYYGPQRNVLLVIKYLIEY